jgi:SulP family sulfate permease
MTMTIAPLSPAHSRSARRYANYGVGVPLPVDDTHTDADTYNPRRAQAQPQAENGAVPSMSPTGSINININGIDMDGMSDTPPSSPRRRRLQWLKMQPNKGNALKQAIGQVPAIVLICMFHLMTAIPFGVSYFPVGWASSSSPSSQATSPSSSSGVDDGGGGDDDDGVNGAFPLPGKEAFGIRMFLFSTIVGQIVFTLASNFKNPIGLQMVENIPFCHELAFICIKYQGYGAEALSTLFFMFGLASVFVGLVFYVLGHFKMGRVVYYIPSHVLVGCIGGIGLFIAVTGMEVTMNERLSISALADNVHLWMVVLIFEVVLRLLERWSEHAASNGKSQYPLLSPIYFCSMTPIFYAVLWILRVPVQVAMDQGYFFPQLELGNNDCSSSSSSSDLPNASNNECSASSLSAIFNEHLFDIWKVIDFSSLSVPAIIDSVPTLLALTLFSLIHVPINIPAFALSSDVEVDMNNELVAHGYSNFLAGILGGGLQNYMAYTQSMLYDKSGGTGQASGIAVAVVTGLLFCVGPTIASYIPRCMAGTLLVHVGIDLFLEGVYDTFGTFDVLEYAGIWLITIVMTLYGMKAAMIAGFITAISTYAMQNLTYVHPLRGFMAATTLRSSRWNRSARAQTILANHAIGRSRILVVQLQGHLFFGNLTQLTDSMNNILSERQGTVDNAPWIVIMDFGLVLGIDSSAAQAIVKLKNAMQSQYKVELCVFVSGSDVGFPTEFDLTRGLSASSTLARPSITSYNDIETQANANEKTSLLNPPDPAITKLSTFSGSHVCDSLDMALVISENALIAREDPSLLKDELEVGDTLVETSTLSEERTVAIKYLTNICQTRGDRGSIEKLFGALQRETYAKDEFVWMQGSRSDSVKLLVRGTLVALLENEAGTYEMIATGNTIGELGLVEGIDRMVSFFLSESLVCIIYFACHLTLCCYFRILRVPSKSCPTKPSSIVSAEMLLSEWYAIRHRLRGLSILFASGIFQLASNMSQIVSSKLGTMILLVFSLDYQLADTFSNLSLHFTFADACQSRVVSDNY